eukprot:m.92781 g.92781  ORF g.92781 m.92781 type:complete len:249 (+) comp8662_c0_seq1:33-779(+)
MDVGEHCGAPGCGRLDFLPISCPGCGVLFCKDHARCEAHGCPTPLETATLPADVDSVSAEGTSCTVPSCSARGHVVAVCLGCANAFCLQHRHAADHDCPVWLAEQARVQAAAARQQANEEAHAQAIARVQEETAKRAAKKKGTAAKVALMKLKGSATGDRSVPAAKRVYLSIWAPGKTSPAPLFFSEDWTLGKLVDKAVIALAIASTHGRPRPYPDEAASEALNTDETIKAAIAQDALANGGTLWLRV